ncbi:nitroreductase family protein [Microbacterium sp. P5_E9]
MSIAEPGSVSTVVIETILARRSVREGFAPRAIDRDDLEKILACGLAAPSSKNARPWRFHVIESAALRNMIADAATRAIGIDEYVPHDPRTGRPQEHWSSTVLESAEVLRVAPTAIAIENRGVFSGGRRTLAAASHQALVASLTAYGLETMGIGTALENIWIAASALGVGAAFLGDLAIAEESARELLGLEGDLMGIVALGYATPPPYPRREPPKQTQVDDPVVWH